MTRHSIEYCGWLEIEPESPSSCGARAPARIWSAVHSETPMYRALPGAHQVGERLHGLFERRLVVVAVCLVQVDVVGPEPAQRPVDRLHDVLAGQAAVVRARGRWPVHLGEDLERLPALALERLAENRLGRRLA